MNSPPNAFYKLPHAPCPTSLNPSSVSPKDLWRPVVHLETLNKPWCYHFIVVKTTVFNTADNQIHKSYRNTALYPNFRICQCVFLVYSHFCCSVIIYNQQGKLQAMYKYVSHSRVNANNNKNVFILDSMLPVKIQYRKALFSPYSPGKKGKVWLGYFYYFINELKPYISKFTHLKTLKLLKLCWLTVVD